MSCCRSMAKRSNKALYGFDDRTRQMILLGVLRGLRVDDALEKMEFTPLIAERVEELRILREEIDPDRAIIGKSAVD